MIEGNRNIRIHEHEPDPNILVLPYLKTVGEQIQRITYGGKFNEKEIACIVHETGEFTLNPGPIEEERVSYSPLLLTLLAGDNISTAKGVLHTHPTSKSLDPAFWAARSYTDILRDCYNGFDNPPPIDWMRMAFTMEACGYIVRQRSKGLRAEPTKRAAEFEEFTQALRILPLDTLGGRVKSLEELFDRQNILALFLAHKFGIEIFQGEDPLNLHRQNLDPETQNNIDQEISSDYPYMKIWK